MTVGMESSVASPAEGNQREVAGIVAAHDRHQTNGVRRIGVGDIENCPGSGLHLHAEGARNFLLDRRGRASQVEVEVSADQVFA